MRGKNLLLVSYLLLSVIVPLEAASAVDYDVVVVGGGTSGIAAAIQAARIGATVAIIEETDWLGGQMTAAGVAAIDDWGYSEAAWSSIADEFADRVRRYYKTKPVTTCTTSSVCFEPHVGKDVFKQMIDDTKAIGLPDGRFPVIDIFYKHKMKRVITNPAGTVIMGVVADTPLLTEITFYSKVVVEATEYGDVLAAYADLFPLYPIYRVSNVTSVDVKSANPPNPCIDKITYTAVMKKYPGGVPSNLKVYDPTDPQKSGPPQNQSNPTLYPAVQYGYIQPFFDSYVSKVAPIDYNKPWTWAVHNSYRGMPDSKNPDNYTVFEPDRITKTGINFEMNDFPYNVASLNPNKKPNKNFSYRKEKNCQAKLRTLQFMYYVQSSVDYEWHTDTPTGCNVQTQTCFGDSGNEMTNGVLGLPDYSNFSEFAGFHGPAEARFDLKVETPVSGVRVHVFNDPATSISYPNRMIVSCSHDDVNYTLLENVPLPITKTKKGELFFTAGGIADNTNCRYVKVRLENDDTAPGPWTFISEIEILRKPVSYTWSPLPDPGYTDAGGTEMTNGILGLADFSNFAEFTGINGSAEALFDLQERTSVARVRAHVLNSPSSCLKYPDKMRVFCSLDNLAFTEIMNTSLPVGKDLVDGVFLFNSEGVGAVCRWLKVRLENESIFCPGWGNGKAWTFVSEIQIGTHSRAGIGESQWAITDADDEYYETDDQELCNTLPSTSPGHIPSRYADIERRFPPIPYVRESRRLVGLETLTAKDIWRGKQGTDPILNPNGYKLRKFPSAVALGSYFIDRHGCAFTNLETALGESYTDIPDGQFLPHNNYQDFRSGPFQIPFNAFIPTTVDGLVAAEKNISVSRLAGGAIRLGASTMYIGQAAGAIAALAAKNPGGSGPIQPRQVAPVTVQAALLGSLNYRWLTNPHTLYPDKGGEMANNVNGSATPGDLEWTGVLGSAETFFDLGTSSYVKEVQAHLLNYPAAGILYPYSMAVSCSNDNITFTQVKSIAIAPTSSYIAATLSSGQLDRVPGHPEFGSPLCRYLTVRFENPLYWTFVSEIEIDASRNLLSLYEFEDVPKTHQFWADTQIVSLNALMIGNGAIVGNGTTIPLVVNNFIPSDSMLREYTAPILLTNAGITINVWDTTSFQDVSINNLHHNAIEEFYRQGFTSGCSVDPPLFCPKDASSKAAYAFQLIQSLILGTSATSAPYYSDVTNGGQYYHPLFPWVQKGFELGFTTPCDRGANTFCPNDPIKRGEAAAFMARERIKDKRAPRSSYQ